MSVAMVLGLLEFGGETHNWRGNSKPGIEEDNAGFQVRQSCGSGRSSTPSRTGAR